MTGRRPIAYGSHISNVLSAAGFTRATSERAGYRALGEHRSWRAGLATDRNSGCASVQYVDPGRGPDLDAATSERADRLAAYAVVLDAAGFDVTVHDTHLLVARPAAAGSEKPQSTHLGVD